MGPGEVTEDLMGRADFTGQGSENGSGQGYFAIRSEVNTTKLGTDRPVYVQVLGLSFHDTMRQITGP